jgi:chromosome transmission fidelity protein 8
VIYAFGFAFKTGCDNRELAGTKVSLKKPLLVLKKKKVTGGAADQEPPMVVGEAELEVIGIIRHKILFKDRPKPSSQVNNQSAAFRCIQLCRQ